MSMFSWHVDVRVPELRHREAHVWQFRLADGTALALGAKWMSAFERRTAAMFLFARRRDGYSATRGVVRHLLGQYCGRIPETIAFRASRYGRPRVRRERSVRFSVSHSDTLGLVAVARGAQIGVDVEDLRREAHGTDITALAFCPPEQEAFRRLATEDRTPAFFRAWVRKEAMMKATGKGLSFGLPNLWVSISPTSRVIGIRGDLAKRTGWQLMDLPLPDMYFGALALRPHRVA